MRSAPNVPRVAPDLVWRLLDDNAVVVSPRAGEVRVLNRVGTIIWQLLIEEFSPSEIESYLVTHFNVERQDARSDLDAFFNDLAERGAIVWETNEGQ